MRIFHPLGVVGRGSETQLQVGEDLNYLIVSLWELGENTFLIQIDAWDSN